VTKNTSKKHRRLIKWI